MEKRNVEYHYQLKLHSPQAKTTPQMEETWKKKPDEPINHYYHPDNYPLTNRHCTTSQ
jgi:hypothetical protein